MRGHGAGLEVFWVRRSEKVSFMPGFHAFVGGVVGPSDRVLPIEGPGDERDRMNRACAIRETFEEIGILVARDGDCAPEKLADARERLQTGEATFDALAREHGWRFHADDLPFAGRWMTPPFATARFDTSYYLARMPEGQVPSIGEDELDLAEWITPAAAIEAWRQGKAVFAAPILHSLRELAAGEEDLAARLASAPERAGQPPRRIELMWGVVLQPIKTKPLPPATHTNAYLVGEGHMALIDPGSDEPAELDALFRLLGILEGDGRKLACILLTHAHPDHLGGVQAVRERYGVPVMAHAGLRDRLAVDRTLADGDRVSLTSPRADWDLVTLHTPGHAPEHLCFVHERTGAIFTGDHVVGGSTVVIDPPAGDMADYMRSLERLRDLPLRFMFPGHGSPQGAASRRIRVLLAHRHERETLVVEALESNPRGLDALVERAYSDTPRDLWPLAQRSLLAHLIKLEREGRAVREADRWRLASPR